MRRTDNAGQTTDGQRHNRMALPASRELSSYHSLDSIPVAA